MEIFSGELIQRLDGDGDIVGMMSDDIFQQTNLYMDNPDEGDQEPDDVIILHMDIREPLRSLQKLLEQKIGVVLKGYKFWLQDAQELEPHKNLVDQCVKGEGLVQINVQIQTINQRINIVDVLKPTDAALAALAVEEANRNADSTDFDEQDMPAQNSKNSMEHCVGQKPKNANPIAEEAVSAKNKPILDWILDKSFKKEQIRLKIPEDPNDWTIPQVKHWFQWAVRQFDLTGVILNDWAITGKELCSLSHEQFHNKLPKDPGNVFWTHLQLLKECKFVSVVHKAVDGALPVGQSSAKTASAKVKAEPVEHKIMRKPANTKLKYSAPPNWEGSPMAAPLPDGFISVPTPIGAGGPQTSAGNAYGVGSGNNGQVQLWQFLLEILTDREHVDIIQWVGTDGEFKLTDPERVARLWGEKKNKPAMNYEKLSRALRYYYDGDMISKVSGKRFAYKFDCDLKLLIGYDAAELSRLVNEKAFVDEAIFLDQIYVQSDDA